jgi:hypothetical protein
MLRCGKADDKCAVIGKHRCIPLDLRFQIWKFISNPTPKFPLFGRGGRGFRYLLNILEKFPCLPPSLLSFCRQKFEFSALSLILNLIFFSCN